MAFPRQHRTKLHSTKPIERSNKEVKLDRGRWNLVSVVQGHIRFLKDEERRISKSAAHTRIQDIPAERLDLQLRAERRELVPLDDARLVLDTAAAEMRAKLMAIPPGLHPGSG